MLGLSQCASAGKILIWPAEFSHWLNLKSIIDELIARGHSVTVVTHSATPSVKTEQSPGYNVDIVEVPYTKQEIVDTLDSMLKYWMYDLQNDNLIQVFIKIKEILDKSTEQNQSEVQFRECHGASLRAASSTTVVRPGGQVYDTRDLLGLIQTPLYVTAGKILIWPGEFSHWLNFKVAVDELIARGHNTSDSPARMSACQRATLCLLFMLGLSQCASAGKILIWPAEFSHWLNLKSIIDELIARGHSVTVVTHSATPSVKTEQSPGYNVDIVEVPYTKQEIVDTLDSMLKYWMYDLQNDNLIQVFIKIKEILDKSTEQNQVLCRKLFAREDLLEKWRKEQFDVLLTDPLYMCGELLAQKLNLPFIISLRFGFGSAMERLCGQLPAPPSFVPAVRLSYTDHMDFPQRLKNFLFILSQDVLFKLIVKLKWDNIFTELQGKPTTLCETVGKADIWLIRTYWDFEYPRPLLPNFKFVGGLHCKPAKPLPKEMEDFVQSSGDDGIVVFSLGSMIKNLTKDRANTIASALGQIPQKVLWRYPGEKPETLAPNTRLYDWIPQNDLLGHPKTKAFITHGGTNGIYEAIYHGVPMVGLPLFADQPDNINHMKTKGAAVTLDFNKMDSKDLKQAVNDVINNPFYKESITRLSRIHHDQPIKPLDQAVYWIEFVMRHKGAKHLRVEAHNLTWYQYHCLDVAAFLLSADPAIMSACERAALCFLLLFGLIQAPLCVTAGKILVWPGEFSHWLNMKTILDELTARGHSVTIITHTATPFLLKDQSHGYNMEIIQVPHTKKDITDNMDRALMYWIYDLPDINKFQAFLKITEAIGMMMEQNKVLCRELFAREDLLEKWRKEKFDALLTDPVTLCGELLAQKLNLPLIISMKPFVASFLERQCGKLPTPSSYVPAFGLSHTDHMDFLQRVTNILFNVFHDIVFNLFAMVKWDPLFSEVMGKPTTLCETIGNADIWLIRTYWDFEYPRPLLPNFKFVGGLHCKPAKPLPKEMEDFVQSSGDDGIVVFSLGSMIKNLTKDRANTIASALGEIPQKVLWRYPGEKPETLAPNTRLYDWIPQNDLLGHPKTKAFITHGGTNGIYEAIYHGVPMVGLPLFGDQPDNLSHMKTKGAAVMLDINKMDSKDLKQAVSDIINNPSYKESITRLSRIHHDQPMKPLDRAVFWIEFVMRHKGAKHLRVEAHNLTWYQYHCLDVAAFLLSVVALEMEDFVQSSGDDGIVVFSLGSMMKNLTKERANTIASALGQIPQKVLWRYTGEKPETLAPNTRLYDWIPQNDLLGHPKTKAFITHGGTNGIYEAIYHGVPMVGLPLFADQPDNLNHMKTKGAAVMLDFNKMDSKDLKQAVNDVINDPSYKQSITKLSRIHHDQPMKPLDQAVYWIEFVMRHKGAKHLRVEAHNLTWYQYHCLDVAAFLLSVIALVMFIFVKTCRWVFRKCCKKTPAKSKRE
ncbi:hypothetical protein QTP70_027040 [Hemibagrus guttatus]|uniref:glucuronosyltransferase n=1 Tax=Hemibagrus guttatus TaxID=175788 RepID=A0AAE0PXR5_9TELE|nr:hypothetical protein QTP70_027040 [Hemibagrus guttatus]